MDSVDLLEDTLLSTWGMPDAVVRSFKENGIQITQLKDLTDKLIKERCPAIGTRLTLKKKIQEFISAEADTITVINSSSERSFSGLGISITDPCIDLDDINTNDIYIPKPQFPEFELKTLLTTSPCGKSVLEYYNIHKSLSNKHRAYLTEIIIWYIFTYIVNQRVFVSWWAAGLLAVLVTLPGNSFDVVCPAECACGAAPARDGGRALRVACARGDMHAVPVEFLDRSAQILIITAPPERPNFLTIGPIFTQPVPFSNLKELQITHSNIPSIGQYSFWGLQNLMILNLSHNNLTGVIVDNFRGLINLTDLYLDHNHIEHMPSETFRHLTALKTLVLSHNEISSLVTRLFRMLGNLYYLDLGYNPLVELNPEVFKDIQRLKIFKCRRCLLRRVNTQIYHLVAHLEELDLGDNQFKYLMADEFISLTKLKKLKLDGNQLPVIVDNTFGRQRQLMMLCLSRNRLALLAPAALTNLTSLIHLDLADNKLDRFHLQTFAPVVDSLKTINFSGNNLPLNEIAIVLQILPELHGVGLANLTIDELPPNFLSYNDHLVALDLSWNNFKKFPYKLLTKTRFLQRLDISHNQLQSLDERSLERLEAISQIDLAKNMWHCDQCSAGTMLGFMSMSVLNGSIRYLKCYTPYRLRGISFAEMTYDRLEPCSSSHEAQMSLLEGLILVVVAVLASVAAALCCTRRRAAHYYTNEEKRREREHEHPEELLGHSEIGSVATIHAPYRLVTKSS